MEQVKAVVIEEAFSWELVLKSSGSWKEPRVEHTSQLNTRGVRVLRYNGRGKAGLSREG